MRKLYEKKEILFAVLWIVAYCIILGTIRGDFGDESIYMLIALLVFSAGIIAFAIIYCTWLGKIKNEKPEDIG